MIVLDREGNFITSWGEGLFNRAHGLHIDPTTVFIAPMTATIRCAKCSSAARCCDHRLPNKPAPFMSGEPSIAAHTALSPEGEI